jgi:hypothetical protein
MKMAKASEADLNMAMKLASVLEDIEIGHFPALFTNGEEIECLDTNDCEQYARLIEDLQELLAHGSISRVVYGMVVVCDPSNECIDPSADTIERHPVRQRLEEQRDELLAALEGIRDRARNDVPITEEQIDEVIAKVKGSE